jgi:biotin transport system substrate-specific component
LSPLTAREIAYAALFTALIAGGSRVAIPLGPVPLTLQVMFVLLAGMVLGPRLGALSVLAYLALGLVAPVYAGGTAGAGVLFGPTGGYLWGFVAGAALAGLAVRRGSDPGLPRFVIAGLAGLVPIYALGVVWLALQLHLDPAAAVAAGVAPFVWGDVLKVLAAALAARRVVTLPLGLPSPQRDR